MPHTLTDRAGRRWHHLYDNVYEHAEAGSPWGCVVASFADVVRYGPVRVIRENIIMDEHGDMWIRRTDGLYERPLDFDDRRRHTRQTLEELKILAGPLEKDRVGV